MGDAQGGRRRGRLGREVFVSISYDNDDAADDNDSNDSVWLGSFLPGSLGESVEHAEEPAHLGR